MWSKWSARGVDASRGGRYRATENGGTVKKLLLLALVAVALAPVTPAQSHPTYHYVGC